MTTVASLGTPRTAPLRKRQQGTVKVSTTLPAEDIAFLESYAQRHDLPSRAAAHHAAVKSLRRAELSAQYGDAYEQWAHTGEAAAWDCVVGDGLGQASDHA